VRARLPCLELAFAVLDTRSAGTVAVRFVQGIEGSRCLSRDDFWKAFLASLQERPRRGSVRRPGDDPSTAVDRIIQAPWPQKLSCALTALFSVEGAPITRVAHGPHHRG
jgi:hypothetical protein